MSEDWIKDARKLYELNWYIDENCVLSDEEKEGIFRHTIEKYMPQKVKFTRQYVFNEWNKKENHPNIGSDLLHLFLKEHGLLEE